MPVEGIEGREPKFEVPLLCNVEVLQQRDVLVDRLGAPELRDPEWSVPVSHVGWEHEGRLIELGDTCREVIAGIPGRIDQWNRHAGAGGETGPRVARAKQILVRGNPERRPTLVALDRRYPPGAENGIGHLRHTAAES